jgi:peptidoglycan/LPS O-acetylase OafA/YrhL
MPVFVGHAGSRVYADGFGWRASLLAQPAVIGFFVLSGFVIASVTDKRERGDRRLQSAGFHAIMCRNPRFINLEGERDVNYRGSA